MQTTQTGEEVQKTMQRYPQRSSRRNVIVLVSIVVTLITTPLSAATAVGLGEFQEPFDQILANLMANYYQGDGVWEHHYYDALQYSALLFYKTAAEYPEFVKHADAAVERVMDLAEPATILNAISQIQEGEGVPEDLQALGASFPTLIAAHQSYAGDRKYDFAGSMPTILGLAAGVAQESPTLFSMSAWTARGATAYYYMAEAKNFRDREKSSRIAAGMARTACELIDGADRYWIQMDGETGYYFDPDDAQSSSWDYGLMLQSLALLYKSSGTPKYLDRARDLLAYADHLRDESGAYCDWSASCSSKTLSSNHLMANAMLLMYDATEDPEYLERARAILSFITGPELFLEDPVFCIRPGMEDCCA